MQKVNVQKIVDKWRRIKEASRGTIQDTSVAEERGSESQWRIKREGPSKREGAGIESKATSEIGGQPKTRKLSGTDGSGKGSRAGRKGKADTVASKSKSVGSVKQSGRKGKGKSDKS